MQEVETTLRRSRSQRAVSLDGELVSSCDDVKAKHGDGVLWPAVRGFELSPHFCFFSGLLWSDLILGIVDWAAAS